MSIENERLRLVPHRVLSSEIGSPLIERTDGEQFEVPQRFTGLFHAVENGASLEMLALGLRASPAAQRFALIAAFLGWLADCGLLADRAAIRMAEALKPDYRWRQSIAFEELASFTLVQLPKGKPLFKVVSASAAFLCGATAFAQVFRHGTLDISSLTSLDSITPVLATFIAVFAMGRSVRAALQFFAVRMISGAESALRLKLDMVSISLACGDISLAGGARAGVGLLVAGLGCLMATASALLLPQLFPALNPVLVTYFTCLLLLADLSPLARSPLTEWFRTLYNTLEPSETTMKVVHVAATMLWSAALGIFIAFPSLELINRLRAQLDFGNRATQVGGGLLGLALIVILVSFIDDLRSAVEYGEGDDRMLVRRLWRRRRRELPVDEAIQQGKGPSRKDLEQLPILRQLDGDTRSELLARAKLADLPEGAAACRQDGTDRSLFILLSGRLAVVKRFEGRRRRVVAMLEPGSVFGEAAFFFGTSRTADVVALEPSRVLELKHDPGMKTMDTQRSEELQLRIWFLQALVSGSFLKHLPSEALDAVIFAGKRHLIKAGQAAMREGQAADACYFLIQGQASVTQGGTLINRMKAGDAFGEIALLRSGSPRTATVIADSDLLCVRIESEAFWKLLASHLPLAIEVERLAEARLAGDRQRAPGPKPG